ncbi:MAG: ABC transporter substrate-binding protein [Candidatus Hodarchaeales archaeon]
MHKNLKSYFLFIIILIPFAIYLEIRECNSSISSTKPIRIGFFSPETSASLYFYAPWSKQGFELGVIYSTNNTNKTLSGRPYEIIYYDTKGLVSEAENLARYAIEEDGLDILVGGTYSDVAAVIANIAKEYQKLYFVTPGADSDLTGKNFNPYTFRIARNNWMDAYAGISYAMDTLKAKNFSILAADYSFGYSGVQTMTHVINEKNGSITLIQYAPLTTTDFTPYINNILSADSSLGIDYLLIVWSGNFAYLWQDLADLNVTEKMNVGGAVIDILSTNIIESNLPDPYTFVGTTGFCVYGYELPNNSVNDWMVNEHIIRNIRPNNQFPGHDYRVPELFTASAFATAQFLVNVTNEISDLDIYDMVNYLESNVSINTPKGATFLRPEDHQALSEFYIAEVWNDTRNDSETYNFLIPKLVQRLSPEEVKPPIESNWTPGSLTKPSKTPGFDFFMVFLVTNILYIRIKRKAHKTIDST